MESFLTAQPLLGTSNWGAHPMEVFLGFHFFSHMLQNAGPSQCYVE